MKKYSLLVFLILFTQQIISQNIIINKVEPPNWWTGMKWNQVQLMVYGKNLNGVSAKFSDSRIKVKKVHKIENASYAFIDIIIPKNLPGGNYTLTLSKEKEKFDLVYPILQREKGIRNQGFSNKDVIYLLMPDRFANGDTSNDSIPGYSDSMQRIPNEWRFGGDLHGMIDKLDYLKDLGITAIWATPLVENNTFRSYHGYSATDFYNIDPRFGSNQLYKKYVNEAHKRGIKVILDHVANHFSDHHPWMRNLPTKDWINGTVEDHLPANHHKMIFTDLYADSSTIKHVEQGWFVHDMVDLNQENPYVQNYIIQNTIWWVEYSGLDGIREDTHPYNNQRFISRWANVVLDEFPTLNIVGEVWTGESDFLASYQKNTFLKKGFNTNLPSLTDFGLRDALIEFVSGKGSMYNIFKVIAKDFLFTDPSQLVTFVDNHDMERIMLYADGNVKKAKLAYIIMMTTRGIPALFYGSEIGMTGGKGHGLLRAPFPGGFTNSERNAFEGSGRTDYENDFFEFLKSLIHLRGNHDAFTIGKMIHYPPVSNVYYYFRESGNEKYFIIINGNEKETEIDLNPIKHQFKGRTTLANILSNRRVDINNNYKLSIEPLTAGIYILE
ncbi:MAG: alpha-amylase family glycosyl hydrolase [Melioribacteraceae bacterium]|nr:alpha-amylase family glycosyl hydrolase [Melioribacteraceae bacterium]